MGESDAQLVDIVYWRLSSKPQAPLVQMWSGAQHILTTLPQDQTDQS